MNRKIADKRFIKSLSHNDNSQLSHNCACLSLSNAVIRLSLFTSDHMPVVCCFFGLNNVTLQKIRRCSYWSRWNWHTLLSLSPVLGTRNLGRVIPSTYWT